MAPAPGTTAIRGPAAGGWAPAGSVTAPTDTVTTDTTTSRTRPLGTATGSGLHLTARTPGVGRAGEGT
ncbi:MAG: hypothetical protein EBX36_04390 [Planctomycetia bacterium]|nr:hypothetical protein [Planctomycetia bacterium]